LSEGLAVLPIGYATICKFRTTELGGWMAFNFFFSLFLIAVARGLERVAFEVCR
jgi:hypothetical protein